MHPAAETTPNPADDGTSVTDPSGDLTEVARRLRDPELVELVLVWERLDAGDRRAILKLAGIGRAGR